jgi:mycoredoxin
VTADVDAVHVYWRRGCGFCMSLRHGLDKLGIETIEHDIWADPDDAATVRHYANGNETVPTVVIGDVGFVNPSAREVGEYLERSAPHLLPDGYEPPSPTLIQRLFGG